jgi:diguanylate cyclase
MPAQEPITLAGARRAAWRRAPQRLATRLLLTIACITLPVLAAAFAWLSSRSYAELQDTVRAELTVQAAITAANAAAALAFDNAREAQAVLQSLQLSPHVVSAALYSISSRAVAAFDKRAPGAMDAGGQTGGAGQRLFRIESPVRVDGEAIGRIVVVGHFDALWRQFLAKLGGLVGVLALVMVAITVLAWWVAARVTRPIGELAGLMDRIAKERDYSLRATGEGSDEIGRLARHFNTMVGRVEQHEAALSSELQQRQRAERQYAELAYRDSVTGLPNRRFFTEELERRLAAAHGGGEAFALLFVDLDNFKGVNDTLGHDAGDQLLRELAQGLRDTVRDADFVCRLGGDEFAIVLTGIDADVPLERILDKVGAAARRAVTLGSAEVSVSASIGVALYPQAGTDAGTLLRNADTAMYHAKASGKDRSVIFAPELLQSATREFLIRSALPRAIERHELALHYQPIVDLERREVIKLEALLRWHGATGRFSPAEFIPIAEETGAIVAIGDWVIDQACAQLALWRSRGLPAAGRALTMSVNVSARQLRDRDFPARVAAALERHRVRPQHLEIELTESQLLDFDATTTRVLAALEGLGLKLVIDDFGAGFSSLAYLSRLSIDGIKVDRALIEDLGRSEGRSVAAAILAMARSLAIDVVAEGVETEEQAGTLASLGYPKAQGWLFGKPMAAEQVVALLSAGSQPLPA